MSAWTVASVANVIGARPMEDCGWAASIEAVVDEGVLHLSGWALCQPEPVIALELWQDRFVEEVQPALPSPDVAALYAGAPGAPMCRFAMSAALPAAVSGQSTQFWLVHGRTTSGRRMHLATIRGYRAAAAATRVVVVGSPRSGTTAVGNALREAMGLPNYGEAHLLPVLHDLIQDMDQRLSTPEMQTAARNLSTMAAHLTGEELRERLGETFRQVYRGLHGGDAFCDKTPGVAMLRALPIALWLWPDVKVVFCQRRGIENVASRLRKFGGNTFADHCRDWSMAMAVWAEVQATLPPGQFRVVDQFDLRHSPLSTGLALATWLGMAPEQTRQVADDLALRFPEQTLAIDPGQTPALTQMGWTSKQIDDFRDICGAQMAAYGYTEDERYRLT